METGATILAIIFAFALAIGIFLLLRGLMLWYFKINQIVDLMTKQLNNLREINASLKESKP